MQDKSVSVKLCLSQCVCVFESQRKTDTQRHSVCAWVSQAIVPENLTRTQDILQTFMQQWSDKQYVVMRKQALACMSALTKYM